MLLLTGHILLIPNFTSTENRKAILTTELTIEELLEVYKIDHTVNRDIRYEKIVQMENYIKQIDTDLGIYIPAIMLAYEGEDPVPEDNNYLFEKDRTFVVLDGQHRIKALESYIEKEGDKNKVNKILKSKITIQVYFNLSEQEKRQLFIEINGRSKKVGHNISVNFDDRNTMNSLVTDLLKNERSPILKMGVEQKLTRIVRPNNTNWISMIRLSRFISYLLLGTQEPSSYSKVIIKKQYEEIFSFLQQYFNHLVLAFPKEPGNVLKNILGHEAIQNTIAIVCHKKIIKKSNKKVLFNKNWKQTVGMLKYIDWRPNSTIFEDRLVLSGGKSSGKSTYFGFSDNKHYDLVPLLEKELTALLN